jgi:hypothetical protein
VNRSRYARFDRLEAREGINESSYPTQLWFSLSNRARSSATGRVDPIEPRPMVIPGTPCGRNRSGFRATGAGRIAKAWPASATLGNYVPASVVGPAPSMELLAWEQ